MVEGGGKIVVLDMVEEMEEEEGTAAAVRLWTMHKMDEWRVMGMSVGTSADGIAPQVASKNTWSLAASSRPRRSRPRSSTR